MINTIFESISECIDFMWAQLLRINQKVPLLTIALGIFLVSTLSRFFIMPLLKDGLKSGSDGYRKKTKKEKE